MAAKKAKSKEYSRGEGAALLRKQLAERKRKPVQNLGKAAAWAGTVALNAIPAGRAASVVAKTVARGKATKITSGAKTVKTKTFTQGNKARIENTPPKKSGAGPNSPIKGTKTKVTYETRKISPKQQAWSQSGLATISKTKQGLSAAKAGAAGAYVAGNSAAVNTKQKADKKKSTKKKK
jgi:hypothetical protein